MLSGNGATVYCENHVGKKQDREWRLGPRLDVCSSNPNKNKRLSLLKNKINLLLNGYRGSLNGVKRLGSEVNHYLYLGPRLIISGAIPPLPYIPSGSRQSKLGWAFK